MSSERAVSEWRRRVAAALRRAWSGPGAPCGWPRHCTGSQASDSRNGVVSCSSASPRRRPAGVVRFVAHSHERFGSRMELLLGCKPANANGLFTALPVTTPPTTAYTLEPVTRLLPRGPPPDNAPTPHRRAPDGAAARKPGAAPSRPGQRLDSHHATMEYINGAAPSFKGLPLPEGLERHNLYASAFRV